MFKSSWRVQADPLARFDGREAKRPFRALFQSSREGDITPLAIQRQPPEQPSSVRFPA